MVVESAVDTLTKVLSEHILALRLCVVVSDKPAVSPLLFSCCKRSTGTTLVGNIRELLQEAPLDPSLAHDERRHGQCEAATPKHAD